MRPILPLLEIPAGLKEDQIERPGPDAAKIYEEAACVATMLRSRGVPFDRRLQLNHPVAGTEAGAWTLDPPTRPLYNIRHEHKEPGEFELAHLEPVVLSESGALYFSPWALRHEVGADQPPEPIVTLRSLGEGTAANEQVRYGLARVAALHELELAI